MFSKESDYDDKNDSIQLASMIPKWYHGSRKSQSRTEQQQSRTFTYFIIHINHLHLPHVDNAFSCLAVLNLDLAIYSVSRLCISGPLQLLLTYLAPSNIGVTKSLGTKSDGPEQFPDAYFLFSPDHMIFASFIIKTIFFCKTLSFL